MINNNQTGSTVKSPLVPAGSNATHYDMFGVGGYREVDTLNDLYYINSKLLLTGCLVYVRSENEIYKYGDSGNFEVLNYDKWQKLEECIKDIKNLQQEDSNLWKAVNTNTQNITELTNKLNSLDFKNYELSLKQSSDKNSVVLTYKKDNSTTVADLPIATTDNPGEIKLGDSTSLDSTNTKNYPVQLDDNNRAYVNVPWTDTITKSNTYKVALRAAATKNSIVLSGSDSTESTADIPIASLSQPGEIKLGNPNLINTKEKHYPLEYNDQDGAFVQVPWTDTVTNPEDITTQFTSFVFTRSNKKPERPLGGSYNHPVPDNPIWHNEIPEGEDPVWSSNAIFTNKNTISVIWSEPILLTDSATIDICYSKSATKPNNPTTHGIQNDDVWHDTPTSDDIWMAMATRNSLIADWGNWNIFKIKGENGKDGTSINILGTYDNAQCELSLQINTTVLKNVDNSHIHYTDTSHTKTIGDCLQIIDSCSETTFNHHIMCLTDSNPETWIDLGGISGKDGIDGTSQYIHVKWSNNIILGNDGFNTNPDASFTESDGEVPGIYRGEYVDDNPNDSTNIKDYKWTRAKGQDGFSYWFFYTATNTNKAPTLSSETFSIDDLHKKTLVNNGVTWYDEIPTDTSLYDPEKQYLWQIWAKDDESTIKFRGPVLYAAPSSDGIAYNVVIHNNGLFFNLDTGTQDFSRATSDKVLTWDIYVNEKKLAGITDSTSPTNPYSTKFEYVDTTGDAREPSKDKYFVTKDNIAGNFIVNKIIIYVYKSGHEVFQYEYLFPTLGKTGKKGEPGIPADTGITILLSNDIAHIPCNPDNSIISDHSSVTTDIQIFKGSTNVTSDCAIVGAADGKDSVSSYITNNEAIQNTIATSSDKFTLTSKLISSTDTNYQYLVPIYVKYNNYIYTKYFTIRKDYTGDVYELIVTPQVYSDADSDKSLTIQVIRTYSRSGHSIGPVTDTDSEYPNLSITVNDDTDKNRYSITGYTTKLTKSSYDVKLYEKQSEEKYNLIDEEVVTRVVGSQGAQGIQGCILRNRGYWNPDVTDYVNEGEYAPKTATEVRYIDYVFLKGTDKCYKVKYAHEISNHNGGIDDGKVTVPPTTSDNDYSPTSTQYDYWTEASSQEFAYIKDLIVEEVNAKTITADEFLVKRENTKTDGTTETQIVAGMVKGDANTQKADENVVFFAGNDSTSTEDLTKSKTYITEGGTLHSDDADITGNVQASQLIVKANPKNLTEKDKVIPSIIFTTYNSNTKVYSYTETGTPITDPEDTNKPVTMESFTNLKDSNGNKLTDGSPVGIVYSLNTNNIYIPTYFFDFAPLITNILKGTDNKYYPYAGATSALDLLTDGKLIYSESDILYTGDVWIKYTNYEVLVNSGTSEPLQLWPAIIWFRIHITNGVVNAQGLNYQVQFTKTYSDSQLTNSSGQKLYNVQPSPYNVWGIIQDVFSLRNTKYDEESSNISRTVTKNFYTPKNAGSTTSQCIFDTMYNNGVDTVTTKPVMYYDSIHDTDKMLVLKTTTGIPNSIDPNNKVSNLTGRILLGLYRHGYMNHDTKDIFATGETQCQFDWLGIHNTVIPI